MPSHNVHLSFPQHPGSAATGGMQERRPDPAAEARKAAVKAAMDARTARLTELKALNDDSGESVHPVRSFRTPGRVAA